MIGGLYHASATTAGTAGFSCKGLNPLDVVCKLLVERAEGREYHDVMLRNMIMRNADARKICESESIFGLRYSELVRYGPHGPRPATRHPTFVGQKRFWSRM
jgi:hypothetical protein